MQKTQGRSDFSSEEDLTLSPSRKLGTSDYTESTSPLSIPHGQRREKNGEESLGTLTTSEEVLHCSLGTLTQCSTLQRVNGLKCREASHSSAWAQKSLRISTEIPLPSSESDLRPVGELIEGRSKKRLKTSECVVLPKSDVTILLRCLKSAQRVLLAESSTQAKNQARLIGLQIKKIERE